ncbi:MAG: hypothetical protein K2H06_04005, partial [Anaeroplasmataceae bacterium]|nr:hypothetical protein [Anaeroplasmataceae bacterium]
MKKMHFLILVFLSIFFLSIPCLAANEDGIAYGLLPQNDNESLRWENTYFKYNLNDYPEDGVFYRTRNKFDARYT